MNHQIPGFSILVIFVLGLGLAISNETIISKVHRALATVIPEDKFSILSQESSVLNRDQEEEEAEGRPLYDLHETAREEENPTLPAKPKIPKCLVNLHIPKVGGRTVGTFLQQVANVTGFERYSLYGHKGEKSFEDIVNAKRALQRKGIGDADNHTHSDSSLSDNQDNDIMKKEHYYDNIFIQGHFSARIFDLYPELKECLIMTVLREPADRAISAFFFHRHKRGQIDRCLSPDNYNARKDVQPTTNVGDEESPPGLVIRRGNSTILFSKPTTADHQGAKLNLAQARVNNAHRKGPLRRGDVTSRSCKLFWQYSNDVTRRFAGLPELPWKCWEMNERKGRKWRDKSRPEEPRRENTFLISSISRMNGTHLARAKENMKNSLGLVCFLHDLPSCAERILKAFQLDASEMDVSIMRTNKTNAWKTKSRPERMEEEVLQKFQKANRLDQQLYDWALKMYS